jgi:hypothetical protein
MHRIVSSITSLAQHFHVIEHTPEVYRPTNCPHCGLKVLWCHGFYHRKADRSEAVGSCNPVPICRFCCAGCHRTCSRLPLCIAPRRWYDWAVQQVVLQCLLDGWSLHRCSHSSCLDRHTVRRWRDWLSTRSETFMFQLRSRFPEWGRIDAQDFWRTMPDGMSLANAMAWLDRDLIVP